MIRFARLLAFLSICLGGSALPKAAPELGALFPKQATIAAPGGRLVRLALPPDVIAQCRQDLSDLRILDRQGREVPYWIDSGPQPDAVRRTRRSLGAEIVDVSREEVAREGAPSLRRERYVIEASGDSSVGDGWDLVIESRQPAFVRRVVVSDDSGKTLAEGSVFRLRQPARERLRLRLPTSPGRLAVTLQGEEPFYLSPVFRFETSPTLAPAERVVFELAEVSRVVGGGLTRLVLERPRGLVPDTLRLATSTPAFHREVEVWDEGPGAAMQVLGRGTVFRVPASAPVEELEFTLSAPRGDRLRLLIRDGDSPPLDDVVVRAVMRRPALLFSLGGDGQGEETARLVFGGGRAWRPHYDLENMLPSMDGADGRFGERLYDPASLVDASLGEIVPNPDFDPAPMLAFAQRPGSVLETRLYHWQRRLDVAPSPEGLSRLSLTLEDLAKARDDLGDLRIVDDQNRQWAYLLEGQAGEEVRPLVVSRQTKGGFSRYRLKLPAAPARLSLLEMETDTAYFDRDFQVVGSRGKQAITLAQGRLARRAGDPRPLIVPCRDEAVDEIVLVVADGDDAPLSLTAVKGHFPVPALYFAAPAGSYSLILGEPNESRPRYELERVRGLILAVPAAEARASGLEENRSYSAGAGSGSDAWQQLLLWVALGGAVLVLTGLTLRLVRKGSPGDQSPQ